MKLYALDINIKTPLLISDLYIGNVLKGTNYSYIPASTIRGGILSKLYREYNIKEVRKEDNEPSFSIRPAYPVINGTIAKPSHKLMYRCKLCSDKDNIFLDKIFKYKNKLMNFKFDNYIPPVKCSKNHLFSISEVKPLVYFKKIDGEWRYIEYKPETMQTESIGINRGNRATEVGMLYSYITLKPGLKYRLLIYDEVGRFSKWIREIPEKDYYFLGRSISRGMGLVEIIIKELDLTKYLENRSNEIKDLIECLDGLIILRALSPILSISDNGLTYDIDLRNHDLTPYSVYKNYNYIPNESVLVKGFSVKDRYTLPKIMLRGLGPGALYFYRANKEKDMEYVSQELAKLELKGFSSPKNIGLNILEVYDDVKYFIC